MSDERDNMKKLLAISQAYEQRRRAAERAAAAAAAAGGGGSGGAESAAQENEHHAPPPQPQHQQRGRRGAASGGKDGGEGGGGDAPLNARDNPREFLQHYYDILRRFCADEGKFTLSLPHLSPYDRHALHALVERCNLSHHSTGDHHARVLHVRKDALFVKHPEAVESAAADLEALAQQLGAKESKYALRRAPRGGGGGGDDGDGGRNGKSGAAGDIGGYDDEETERRLRRLRAATNEYRHATPIGYAPDADAEERLVEERLAGRAPPPPSADHPPSGAAAHSAPPSSGSGSGGGGGPTPLASKIAAVLASSTTVPSGLPAPAPAAAGKAPPPRAAGQAPSAAGVGVKRQRPAGDAGEVVARALVCRRCNGRVPLAVGEAWQCTRHCNTCGRTTVWQLHETRRPPPPPPSAAEAAPTGGAAATGGDSNAHDDGEDEEDEEGQEGGDALTAEDVSETMALNDYSDGDRAWARRFASELAAAGAPVGRHLLFCIDYADLTDARAFRPPPPPRPEEEKEKEKESPDGGNGSGSDAPAKRYCYVALTALAEPPVPLHRLLEETTTAALTCAAAETGAAEDAGREGRCRRALRVALPNVSVYGAAATALCLLVAESPTDAIDAAALQALERRYGRQHVRVADSLQEAIAHLTGAAGPTS